MTSDTFPRLVFRVKYRGGKPYVTTRMMIARSGSWFTTQLKDGSTEKENGNYWSDTVIEALQREAEWIMHRFECSVFDRKKQIRSMDDLIFEAMEWGRLLEK